MSLRHRIIGVLSELKQLLLRNSFGFVVGACIALVVMWYCERQRDSVPHIDWTAASTVVAVGAAIVALFVGLVPTYAARRAAHTRAEYLAIALTAELEEGMLHSLAVAMAAEDLADSVVTRKTVEASMAHLLVIDLPVLDRCVTHLDAFPAAAARQLARTHAETSRVMRLLAPLKDPSIGVLSGDDVKASSIAGMSRPLYTTLEETFRMLLVDILAVSDADAAVSRVADGANVLREEIHATS